MTQPGGWGPPPDPGHQAPWGTPPQPSPPPTSWGGSVGAAPPARRGASPLLWVVLLLLVAWALVATVLALRWRSELDERAPNAAASTTVPASPSATIPVQPRSPIPVPEMPEGPQLSDGGSTKAAKVIACRTEADALERAISAFDALNGRYPSSLAELADPSTGFLTEDLSSRWDYNPGPDGTSYVLAHREQLC